MNPKQSTMLKHCASSTRHWKGSQCVGMPLAPDGGGTAGSGATGCAGPHRPPPVLRSSTGSAGAAGEAPGAAPPGAPPTQRTYAESQHVKLLNKGHTRASELWQLQR